MLSMITYLQDNILTILLWLASIPVTIILTLYFRKTKHPLYAIKSINLIDDSLTDITDVGIFYKEKKVNSFTISKIVIWNKGKETLNYSDLADKNKLRILTKSPYEIINFEILQVSSTINGVEVVKEGSEYFIMFDFLEKDQGFVLKIFHTGSKSDDVKIKGTFKGCGEIKKAGTSPFIFRILGKYNIPFRYLLVILYSIPMFFLGASMAFFLLKSTLEQIDKEIARHFFLSYLWFPLVCIFILSLILFFARVGSKNIPSKFTSFINYDF